MDNYREGHWYIESFNRDELKDIMKLNENELFYPYIIKTKFGEFCFNDKKILTDIKKYIQKLQEVLDYPDEDSIFENIKFNSEVEMRQIKAYLTNTKKLRDYDKKINNEKNYIMNLKEIDIIFPFEMEFNYQKYLFRNFGEILKFKDYIKNNNENEISQYTKYNRMIREKLDFLNVS